MGEGFTTDKKSANALLMRHAYKVPDIELDMEKMLNKR